MIIMIIIIFFLKDISLSFCITILPKHLDQCSFVHDHTHTPMFLFFEKKFSD